MQRWKPIKVEPKKEKTHYERCPSIAKMSDKEKLEMAKQSYCCKNPERNLQNRPYCPYVRELENTRYTRPSQYKACSDCWDMWLLHKSNSLNGYFGIPDKNNIPTEQIKFTI